MRKFDLIKCMRWLFSHKRAVALGQVRLAPQPHPGWAAPRQHIGRALLLGLQRLPAPARNATSRGRVEWGTDIPPQAAYGQEGEGASHPIEVQTTPVPGCAAHLQVGERPRPWRVPRGAARKFGPRQLCGAAGAVGWQRGRGRACVGSSHLKCLREKKCAKIQTEHFIRSSEKKNESQQK